MSDAIYASYSSNAQFGSNDAPVPLQGWSSAMSQLQGALEGIKQFNPHDPCFQVLMGSLTTLEAYVKKAGGAAFGDFEQFKNDVLNDDQAAANSDFKNLSRDPTPMLSPADFNAATADALNTASNESFINDNPTLSDMNQFQGLDAMLKDFLGNVHSSKGEEDAYKQYLDASAQYQAGVPNSGGRVEAAINALTNFFS